MYVNKETSVFANGRQHQYVLQENDFSRRKMSLTKWHWSLCLWLIQSFFRRHVWTHRISRGLQSYQSMLDLGARISCTLKITQPTLFVDCLYVPWLMYIALPSSRVDYPHRLWPTHNGQTTMGTIFLIAFALHIMASRHRASRCLLISPLDCRKCSSDVGHILPAFPLSSTQWSTNVVRGFQDHPHPAYICTPTSYVA